jgi:ketosteroid isomerase-like protein
MSGDNVEMLDRIYEEWFESRTLGADLLAEDVEWVNPPDAVERGVRRGIDSFNDAIRSVFQAWEEARFETERVFDQGNDVVALGRVRGLGRGAGIEVVRPHGEIWTFRDGRAVRMRWFNSHSETLEAAGLWE